MQLTDSPPSGTAATCDDRTAMLTEARKAVDRFRDFARIFAAHGMHFKERDRLVMAIHRAIDAAENPPPSDPPRPAADPCPRCEGTGQYQRPLYESMPDGSYIGVISGGPCALCNGTGLMSEAVKEPAASPPPAADGEAAWERMWSVVNVNNVGLPAVKAEFLRILAEAVRETREACAKIADDWLKVQGHIGPLQTMGIHNAAEGIARDIRRAT